MKSKLQIIACFFFFTTLVRGDDSNSGSPDSARTISGVATAKVILVGNDERWLEIHVPVVEIDRDGRKTSAGKGKLIRMPIHRTVAWNARGKGYGTS